MFFPLLFKLHEQFSSTSLEVSVFLLKRPSAYFRALFEAHRESSSASFLLPCLEEARSTHHIYRRHFREQLFRGLCWRKKINCQRDLHSPKESLALQITGQASEKPALVSTQEADTKSLQLAFILTGRERSANPTHLWHMRINLSSQGKMKSKNYPLCLQPSRRTETHIS